MRPAALRNCRLRPAYCVPDPRICSALPAAAVDDLVERAAVGPLQRHQRAGRPGSRARAARRRSGPRGSRAAGAPGPGPRRPRGCCRCRGRPRRSPCSSWPGRGRTAASPAGASSSSTGPRQTITAAALGDVRRAAPDLRELRQLRAIGHEHEVPGLPVARRGSAPARLQDPVEIGVRERPLVEHAHVAPRPDRVPGFHAGDDSASLRATGVPIHG